MDISETMVFHNVFTAEEIAELLEHFAPASIAAVEGNGTVNKNLDYQLEDSVSYRIIHPKIHNIIGDHVFGSGSYKECNKPYGVHYDNNSTHNAYYPVFDRSMDKNKVFLIPLVEGPEFSTVTYNIFSDNVEPMNVVVDEKYLGADNGIDPAYFSHIPEPARAQQTRLPVDVHYHWKLGDMLVWRRDQLHTSTNFLRFGKDIIKKFIVIFVA